MAPSVSTKKTKQTSSPGAELRKAQRAYERALREAGISVDDFNLLRELAQQTDRPTMHPGGRLSRIYV